MLLLMLLLADSRGCYRWSMLAWAALIATVRTHLRMHNRRCCRCRCRCRAHWVES